MKILIDNGHGIDTLDIRSPDGLFREYLYNREIARRIVSELTDCGYDAQLLVPEESDIPLKERCHRKNAISDTLGRQNIILSASTSTPLHRTANGTTPPAGAHIHQEETLVPISLPPVSTPLRASTYWIFRSVQTIQMVTPTSKADSTSCATPSA